MRPGKSLRGFSLIELLVVTVVILLLIAILLPALRAVQWTARDANTTRQMEHIAQASSMYAVAYGHWPGWFADRALAARPGALTQNESMALSLLGLIEKGPGYWPAGHANPDGLSIAVNRIGTGPVSRPEGPGSFHNDAFLSVTDDQVHAVRGTTGTQNDVPELVDASTGLPFLIWRAQPGVDGSVWVDDKTSGLYLRNTAVDYLEANTLQSASGDMFDQQTHGLLSAVAVGSAAQANRNASVLLRQGALGPAGLVMAAPGCDGLYFSMEQNTGPDPKVLNQWSEARKMDDVVRLFGAP